MTHGRLFDDGVAAAAVYSAGTEDMINHIKLWSDNLKERHNLEDLRGGVRIWFLKSRVGECEMDSFQRPYSGLLSTAQAPSKSGMLCYVMFYSKSVLNS
jgi:hypothetical protein